jgi:hypothetical protein
MADTVLAVPSVAASSVQGNVDVAPVTNPALNSTVLRENVVNSDPVNYVGQAQVTNARGLMVDNQMIDMTQAILIELRVISQILADGLNVRYDPGQLRDDTSLLTTIEQ